MRSTGQVISTVGGVYRVRLSEGETVEASLRGRLKRGKVGEDRVVTGDRVRIEVQGDGAATIEEVLPRESVLLRSGTRGRTPKVVAANVDQVLVVASVRAPAISPEVMDRFLVVAESNDLPPILVVNKTDLVPREEVTSLEERYGKAGYPVLGTSATTGEGLRRLETRLTGSTSVVVGPSGVGKSSLLNALNPELELRVGELSRKAARGRHTTVRARLLPVGGGGWVVDTPGFSDAAPWGVEPQELGTFFPEIRGLSGECRFRGCLHRSEPGCRVKDGVERGELDAARYRSYLRFLEEVESEGRSPRSDRGVT